MSDRSSRHARSLLGLGVALWAAVVLPLTGFFVFAFLHLSELSFTGVVGPAVVSVVATSTVGLLGLVFGVPLAYVLATSDSRWVKFLGSAVRLPLGLPPLASGVILLLAVGPYTLLGRATGGRLVNSVAGVVVAEGFVAIPYIVESAKGAFAQNDSSSSEVARAMGLSPLAVFLLVALPDAWRGVRSGLALGWLRAFGEFGATILVAYHPYSLPILTYVQFSGTGLPSAVGVVIVTVLIAGAGSALLFALPYPRRSLGKLVLRRPSAPTLTPSSELPRRPMVGFRAKAMRGDFDLEAQCHPNWQRLAVLGYSGAGKSLLLSVLAGLYDRYSLVSQVLVEIDGVSGRPDSGLLEGRRVSWVPQNSGLFNGYTVQDQLGLVAAVSGISDEKVTQLVADFEVGHLMKRSTAQLSGGQRQQVALVRALMLEPRLLLLDEAFSAMDSALRRRLQRVVLEESVRESFAMVVVSHDVDEAFLMGESIMVMDGGRVLRMGKPRNLLEDPQYLEVAEIVGYENIFRPELFGLGCSHPYERCVANPSALTVSRTDPSGQGIRALVVHWVALSGTARIILATESGGETLEAFGSPSQPFEAGELVWIHLEQPKTLLRVTPHRPPLETEWRLSRPAR